MYNLKLQEMTPEVYCKQSRDFQVFCRAFDTILNGVKFDIDTSKKITNTLECKDTILSLLQTKLGFFTDKSYNSTTMRYMLSAFPYLVKNKGSLQAIKSAIRVYTKATGINPDVKIWYSKDGTLYNSLKIKPHSLIIGIEGNYEDISILLEVFRYILPVGVFYYFFFYEPEKYEDTILFMDKAELIYSPNTTGAILKSN